MDKMKAVYLEEASELLENIETSLLALEPDPNDTGLIEELFRALHTLKGNSSMFGLDKIAEFLHNIETIYDRIRDGLMEVNRELLDCTLLSIDHVKNIIHDSELTNKENESIHEDLTGRLLALLNQEELGSTAAGESSTSGQSSYYIRFVPGPETLKNGTNPLFLLSELKELGKCQVMPHFKKLESFEKSDMTLCYVGWELFLITDVPSNQIMDVFVFVEGDSEIKVELISNSNILGHPEVVKLAEVNSDFSDVSIDYQALGKLTNSSSDIEPANGTTPKVEASGPSVKVEDHGKSENISSIRVSSEKLDHLLSIVSEMVTTQAGLGLYAETNHSPALEVISENVEKLSRQLRDVAFGMTLIPVKSIMGRFQRLVRDTSKSLNKSVKFVIEGDETELDKNIIESLTDPLMHILRNSLDHGIEPADVRSEKGKPKEGTILFKAYYSGANVHIQITDDGKGLDSEAIKEKAIRKGLITEDASLSDKDIYDLVFAPGFSTATEISNVSGRGVGMDVVRKNISTLRGEIVLDSQPGEGTTIVIKLPLTLSIIDGLLVRIETDFFVIPLSVISKCFEVKYDELEQNFDDLVILDGDQVPYINLRKEFKLDSTPHEISQLIVVENEERKVGISVDTIVGEYQAVLKPLGKYYGEQDFVSGATILGDGSIALVLDTNKIINSFSTEFAEQE